MSSSIKNIHVISTSKPSKLLKDLVDKTYQFKKYFTFGNRIELPLNIYITSDEEIKEGDWCIDDEGIVKCTAHAGAMNHYYTKIILTTDQDLIKDGVQTIDDEFLEWFVKNPTFEFVEIDEYPRFDLGKGMYKIIIPKEEPKQENTAEYIDRHIVEAMVEVAKQKLYSEEDLDAFRKFMIQEQNFSKSCLDVFVEQFKKK